jgi:uncharacterized protein (DUF305 family)
MNRQAASHLLIAAGAALALFAAPVASKAQAHGGAHGTAAPAAPSQTAGGMDMMSMMNNNHQKMMSMPMTGKPDVDFDMMMRMHHLAGIPMAQAQLRHGEETKMREMARKIIASQKKEIGQLEAFLARQGHPVDDIAR